MTGRSSGSGAEASGSHPSIYRDYLEQNPEGGLQHLAVWVDNVDDALARLTSDGVAHKVWQRYGIPPDYEAHAYIDLTEQPGVMMQLMARSDFYDMMFGLIHAAAQSWDGKTDPIRILDPASASLVAR